MSNPFLNTQSGKQFTLVPVYRDRIDVEDIAHALSHICRFNGHTNKFYSVAQHSLMVSDKIPGTPRERLAALLHDAAEAFVCDIPSPIKPLLGHKYHDLYEYVQRQINLKFGVHYVLPITYYKRLKEYDKAACVLEAQAFFGLDRKDLRERGFSVDLVELWTPWEPTVLWYEGGRDPETCRYEFLDKFYGLQSTIVQENDNVTT